ncbi:MAG: divergent polysaccharide deacetylase family protein [Spirochaetaceae bacterium]|nr:MAG: divergent polysaccharide deacetylase family protein [Spirochaetaceae bacterium]
MSTDKNPAGHGSSRSRRRTTSRHISRTPARRTGNPSGRALLLLGSIALLLFALVLALPRGELQRLTRVPVAPDSQRPDEPPSPATQPPAEPRAPGLSERPAAPEADPLPPPVSRSGWPADALPEAPQGATLYIVIDDAGYSLRELEPFLRFPHPVTISVLPHLRRSAEAAERARSAGKDVMLHLPMEANNGADPGPGAIYVDLEDGEIRQRVVAALESVPGAVGVNNHMGSRATADRRVMDAVMSVLGENGGWFMDSRTTAETVARQSAEAAGIPFVERHVFLDNERTHEYIRAAVIEGLEAARERGHAVMIGHVMVPEVAEVLMQMYPDIIERGFAFGPISQLIAASTAYERSGN